MHQIECVDQRAGSAHIREAAACFVHSLWRPATDLAGNSLYSEHMTNSFSRMVCITLSHVLRSSRSLGHDLKEPQPICKRKLLSSSAALTSSTAKIATMPTRAVQVPGASLYLSLRAS